MQPVLQGRRRWPSNVAIRRDDGAFYSYPQWLQFFRNDEAVAQEHWFRGLDETAECPEGVDHRLRVLRKHIAQQPLATPEELFEAGGGKVVLQCIDGHSNLGNSLRVTEDGTTSVDFKGGAGNRAILDLTVVGQGDNIHVQLKSQVAGYLRCNGGYALDFQGCGEQGLELSVFEVFQRSEDPLVSIGLRGSSIVLGTFLIRRAPLAVEDIDAWSVAGPWWHAEMMRVANAKAAADCSLKGRRRLPQDHYGEYYSFVEFVKYADNEWASGTCPAPEAAVCLAEAAWKAQSTAEDGSDVPACGRCLAEDGLHDAIMDCMLD